MIYNQFKMKYEQPIDVLVDRLRKGRTCFAQTFQSESPCQQTGCRLWINDQKNLNCTQLSVVNNMHRHVTLQEIGDLNGLTRMRVCQIEKRAIMKLNRMFFNSDSKLKNDI